jgi:O-methyltransferase involved in polyketide biosynthesis
MSQGKTAFAKEKETMLITLYGRAMQSRSRRPILSDPWAEEAIRRIDYDFAKFKVGMRAAWLFAGRAAQLDLWTSRFLDAHPSATVLHLGCGMDSRVFRVDPPAGARWFDVDYPDVIALRNSLYPERPGYRTIGTSLADLGWLREIPREHPALMVAEGVTMYLTEPIVKALLNAIVDHFPRGQMAFDVHTPQLIRWITKHGKDVRGTGATFHWGIGDPRDIQRLEPRLEPESERLAHQSAGHAKMPWPTRAFVRALGLFPSLRMMRCLLYRFER